MKSWATQQGWALARQESPALDETRFRFATPEGQLVLDVLAHGTSTGFAALHARDERSGTFDTFKSLVLGEAALSPAAAHKESTGQLAAAVAADPLAIGFVGLAGVGRAKALALSERGTVPMVPTDLSVGTEDYVLSRRLFLYSSARPRSRSWRT